MPVYSHSRIGTFENCPLQYKFRYIDKAPSDVPNTIEAFMGSRVHETLEKLYKDLKYKKLNSIEELLEYFNTLWQENWDDGIVVNKKEYTAENYRLIGEDAIRKYYARFEPFETRNIGLEMNLILTLDDGHKIRGVIDRLDQNEDGIYEIHDYKTSGHLPTQEQIDRDRQLALYSIMVRNDYPDCRDVRLIWHYLAFDKNLETRKTEEELEELKMSVQEKIEKIESATEYPPHRSNLCGWCGFKRICPEWKDQYKNEEGQQNPVFTDVDGTELVDRYAELTEKKKEIDAELKELDKKAIEYGKAKDVTRIFGTDHEISIKTSSGIKLPSKSSDDRAALIQVLKEVGKYDEVSETELNISTLKKIIKEKQWPEDVIVRMDPFINAKESVKITLKKNNE